MSDVYNDWTFLKQWLTSEVTILQNGRVLIKMEVHFIYFKYILRNKGKQQERMLKESKRAHQMNWRYVNTHAVKGFMPPLQ